MRNVAFLGILMHLFKKNITSMSGMLLNVCAKHVPVWGKRGHGRAITGTKIILTCPLFESRTESYFDTTITSIGVVLSISEVLVKYDLFQYFESWFNNSAFPTIIQIGKELSEMRSKFL